MVYIHVDYYNWK